MRTASGQAEAKFMGIGECARFTGLGYDAIRDSILRGDFPFPWVRVGHRYLISRPAVEAATRDRGA